MGNAQLAEWCRIPTSGGRAVEPFEPFELDGMSLLAIPQLAYDQPDLPANMNGGDSDTDLVILRRNGNRYEPFQTVPAPGGEDAEFFRIGDKAFLATANIRSGNGPYQFATDSVLHAWTGSKFEPFQAFGGFAAKQWRHFTIADQHFLALAQGVSLPGTEGMNKPSHIFRWDGESFQPFQDIPSRWAYNWRAFTVGGHHFLAHADHVDPSRLYRWGGDRFVVGQSKLLRWDGERFAEHDVLDGEGAREFAVFSGSHGLYVVRINFILGTPAAPTTALTSQLYRWDRGTLTVVDEFPTFGGTDVAAYFDDEGILVAVSNALSSDVRFATESVIYRFIE